MLVAHQLVLLAAAVDAAIGGVGVGDKVLKGRDAGKVLLNAVLVV